MAPTTSHHPVLGGDSWGIMPGEASSLFTHLSPCKAGVRQGLQMHVMDELRRCPVLLPETGAWVLLVLLKCFYVLENMGMTQSNSGSSGAVPAFTRGCVWGCVFMCFYPRMF